MKLTLTNFRCYRSTHVFRIDDSGITLITGPSGTGKTTILMALHFVLTGNCPPKVITDGCDTCTVQLERECETIVRSRRPNRVIFQTPKGQWEDDVAQAHINRKWGRYFEITSYIQQQYQKTFLYQTPSEKLEILEQLCFDVNPEILKKKCSIQYKTLNNEHLLIKGKHDTLSKLIQESEAATPPEGVPRPDVQEYQTLTKNLQTLKKQESDYYNSISSESKIQEVQQHLQDFRKKLSVLQLPAYSKKKLENNLHLLRQLVDLPPLRKVWERIPKEDAQMKIVTTEQHIQLHKEFKILLKKVEELDSLEEQLRKLSVSKNNLLKVYEGKYECPQCKSAVSLINEQLVLVQGDQKTHMSSEEKKAMLAEIDKQIIVHQREIAERLPCRVRKDEIQKNIDIHMNIEDLEKELEWLQGYYRKNSSLELQNNAHQEQQQHLNSKLIPQWDKKQTNDALEIYRSQESITQQMEYFEKHLQTLLQQRPSTLNTDIRSLKILIEQTERRIQEHNTQKHAYEMYQLQLQQHHKYLEHLHELEILNLQMKNIERKMTAVAELKQIILRTESEVINEKVRQISQIVNTYLRYIFTEPITVQLQTLKKTQTQNEKVQVQLEVYYKNMKCDVSILSGGEQARLNLSFILAFAHVFQSPLLLLDECTSNLDAELTETVIQQIEHVGIPKVIMIAHQIVEGNFKQILKVG